MLITRAPLRKCNVIKPIIIFRNGTGSLRMDHKEVHPFSTTLIVYTEGEIAAKSSRKRARACRMKLGGSVYFSQLVQRIR